MSTVSLLCSALLPPAHFTHFCLPRHSARRSVRPKVKDVHHSFCTAAFRAHSHKERALCQRAVVWTPRAMLEHTCSAAGNMSHQSLWTTQKSLFSYQIGRLYWHRLLPLDLSSSSVWLPCVCVHVCGSNTCTLFSVNQETNNPGYIDLFTILFLIWMLITYSLVCIHDKVFRSE